MNLRGTSVILCVISFIPVHPGLGTFEIFQAGTQAFPETMYAHVYQTSHLRLHFTPFEPICPTCRKMYERPKI